jgi:hypothetical protein
MMTEDRDGFFHHNILHSFQQRSGRLPKMDNSFFTFSNNSISGEQNRNACVMSFVHPMVRRRQLSSGSLAFNNQQKG